MNPSDSMRNGETREQLDVRADLGLLRTVRLPIATRSRRSLAALRCKPGADYSYLKRAGPRSVRPTAIDHHRELVDFGAVGVFRALVLQVDHIVARGAFVARQI